MFDWHNRREPNLQGDYKNLDDALRADDRSQRVPEVRQPAGVLAGLYALLVVALVVLAYSTVKNWQAADRIAALVDRIDRIDEFEKRISKKLETFNSGIQLMQRETNDGILTLSGAGRSGDDKSLLGAVQLKALEEKVERLIEESSRSPEVAPPRLRNVRRSVKSPQSTKTKIRKRQSPSVQFKRVVQADGSVSYARDP